MEMVAAMVEVETEVGMVAEEMEEVLVDAAEGAEEVQEVGRVVEKATAGDLGLEVALAGQVVTAVLAAAVVQVVLAARVVGWVGAKAAARAAVRVRLC